MNICVRPEGVILELIIKNSSLQYLCTSKISSKCLTGGLGTKCKPIGTLEMMLVLCVGVVVIADVMKYVHFPPCMHATLQPLAKSS